MADHVHPGEWEYEVKDRGTRRFLRVSGYTSLLLGLVAVVSSAVLWERETSLSIVLFFLGVSWVLMGLGIGGIGGTKVRADVRCPTCGQRCEGWS